MSNQHGRHGASRMAMLDRPKGRDHRYLYRMFGFMRPYGLALSIAAIALVITAGATLSIGLGVKFLIDNGLSADDPAFLDRSLYVLIGIILVISVGTYFRFYYVSWVGERVVADIRKAVYGQVLKLSPGFFEVTRTGEILSRLTADTSLLQTVIGSSLSIALRNLLTLIGGVGLLIYTNATLTGLVALVVPAVVVPIIWYGRKVRRLSRDSQDRVADVGAYAEESLNAIRTVQAYSHETVDKARFGHEVEGAFTTAVRRIAARAMLGGTVILLVFGAISVILWAGGQAVISGRITAGELTSFVFYAVLVAGATGALTEVYGDLQRAAGATERLVELLETEPDIRPPAVPVDMPVPARGVVCFDAVTFYYPSRPDAAAINGLSLDIEPGDTIALVGPSGAGKSTVFQLLLRFYDPQGGSVSIDGIDLKLADPVAARSRIGLVSQDPVIFAADAWENIRYGRPDASDEEVRAAAEAAVATEFLDRLPDGLSTFLGEKGMRLSGGQKQRLTIARAILRDPAVLLLDEATSALDAENERLVQQALEGVMDGRTTMVIAHRLATVVNADRIAVLDDGRLIDTGPHEALLASSPLYARLAALQFSAESGVEEKYATL
jgi:ATP-binding cassette subfamily B protein